MAINKLPKNLPHDAELLRNRFDARNIDADIIEDGETVVVTTTKADFLTFRDDIHKTMLESGYRVEGARTGTMLFVPDYENETGMHA